MLPFLVSENKLRPRYIRSFEILQRVKDAANKLALLPKLFHIHNVFHVLMLRKYELNSSHVVSYDKIKVNEHATFMNESIQIVD